MAIWAYDPSQPDPSWGPLEALSEAPMGQINPDQGGFRPAIARSWRERAISGVKSPLKVKKLPKMGKSDNICIPNIYRRLSELSAAPRRTNKYSVCIV